jgi:pyruvate,water dikinase
VYFSFAAIQGVLEPITPLGQDAIRWLFAGGASLFELDFTNETQPLILIAGERLWVNISNALQNPLGSRIMRRFISLVDPSLVNILVDLLNDPDSGIEKGQLRFSTLRRFLRFAGPFLKGVYGFIRDPGGKAAQIHDKSQAEISRLKEKYPLRPGVPIDMQETMNLFLEIRTGFTYGVPHIAPAAAGGLIPFFMLNKIAQHLTGSNQLALEITRGLPNNVTTEMDLQLWDVAKRIRADQETYQHISSADTEQLVEEFSAGQLPTTAQAAITDFLGKFGMRGLGEIDLGRKRWREDPTYVIEIILNYLQIDDPALAPDVIFQNGEHAAEGAIKELQSIAHSTFGGRFKAALIGYLAVRERALAGLRESPKFHIIQLMGIIRQGLLESGQQLVAEGKIDRADDLFYLYYVELEQLANEEDRNWRALIKQRRESSRVEGYRKQIPRLLLSDGRAFYEGITSSADQTNKLTGSPVSPGMVEGAIRVVTDPINPGLQPGEIMVCQGTDPAWTPLFLTAGGLIMEIGGMITHGAIVAREYGIPAVVGINRATDILQTGQRVQLNGTTGEVFLLDS